MVEESLKKQAKRGIYWKFFQQFSNYGIQFVIGVFMARILSPSDYGITALPAVFIAIAGIFVGGGFGAALVRKPEVKEEDLSTVFLYSMGVGTVCYILLFIAAPWIADFYNTPVLKPIMRVTALSFIYNPIGTPQSVILQRRLDFKTPAKISAIVMILSGAIGVTMAYTGYGVWALVISSICSGVLGQIITISVVRWYPKTWWSNESFNYLWGYGNKMILSNLLDTIYNNITPIIVGKFFTTADLGVYNRAQGYAAMPSKNIHGVVRDVSFPVLSKLQGDPDKLVSHYRKMINVSTFVIFPLMMLLAAVARPLIITMITVKWEACIILLQLMCFSMMWYPLHGLNLNILMVSGRTDLFLRLEVIKKVLGLLIMCVFLPLGIVEFTAAGIFSSIVSVYINSWYTGKLYDFGFKEQIKEITPTLLLGFFMFVSVLLVTSIIPSMLLQLAVGVCLGTAIYIGGAYLFRFPEIVEIKYLLNRK